MSDEEEQYSEEEEEEIEEGGGAEEAGAESEPAESEGAPEETKARRPPPVQDEEDGSSMSEAERAMLAAKKRHEAESANQLLDYEERRRLERDREEEELRLLKQRQEERKKQREEDEREFNERMKKDEARRKAEEEERRQKMENEKKKRDEEKRKKQEMSAGIIPGGEGPNFKIDKKSGDEKADKFSNIVQAKQEMRMTKEQQDDAKRSFLAIVSKTMDISGLLPNDLKETIKKLHQRMCKIEADKYDLEVRQKRQEYDLKELTERQRQASRVKYLQQGVDPTDAVNTRHPPKVSIVSRFDRQIDRRNFKERRALFDKSSVPHFPNIPPPATILEFKIPAMVKVKHAEDYDEEEEE